MKRAKLLKNQAGYTSSTDSIKMVANNIEGVSIGYRGLQNTTTAPTLANLIGHSSAIKLTVGGEVETLVRHDDLYVLNHVFAQKGLCAKPYYVLGGGDNYPAPLKTFLPIQLTTDKEVYIQLDYSGVTNVDGDQLTLMVNYRDKPYPRRPISLSYITGTTVAGAFGEFDMSRGGRNLVGLLLFATTIPEGSATVECTLEEVKLLVKRDEKFHAQWYCLDKPFHDPEDTTVEAILDGYAYIDLEDEPIPADDLKLAVKGTSGMTADAFRAVGIYK